MALKQKVIYRHAIKKDYQTIVEFIRKNNLDGWECTSGKTSKWLSKLYFYEYLMIMDMIIVAEYRGHVVGTIFIGNPEKKQNNLLYKFKRLSALTRLKITKEGRINLDNLAQIKQMQNDLLSSISIEKEELILFFYVDKKYSRNGIGTGLLNYLVEEEGKINLQIFLNQRNNSRFMESHGFRKVADKENMMEVNKQRYREKIALYQHQ